MDSQMIPRAQWPKFFKNFSRVHLGQSSDLWIYSSDAGLRPEAKGLPLIGISIDRTQRAEERIDVIIGDSPEAHVTHQVFGPDFVRLGISDGQEASLEVGSADGTIAFIRLKSPAAANTPASFA
jgi:hypothetical protein